MRLPVGGARRLASSSLAFALVVALAPLAVADGWLEGTRDADELGKGANFAPDYEETIREFGRLEDRLAEAAKQKRVIGFYLWYTPG